jgi:hypothetical protein
MKIVVDSKGYIRFNQGMAATPQQNQKLKPVPGKEPQGSQTVVADQLGTGDLQNKMNTATTATRDQIKVGLQILMLMADAIREVGSVPSGVLYSIVMHRVDLHGFERALDTLVGAGLVSREPNFLLKWAGPEKQTN